MNTLNTNDATATSRLTAFAFLWALAALASLISRPLYLVAGVASLHGFIGMAVMVSALVVLHDPRSLERLGSLCLAIVAMVLVELPEVPNHRLVLFFVSLAVLLAFARGMQARKTGDDLRVAVWNAFSPAGRWTLVLVYAFAFFAKLNHGYFDTEHSCALSFYDNVREWFYLPLPAGPAVDQAVLWGSIIVELLLPIFLIVRKTRLLGILLGLLFHLGLALDLGMQFYNFTSAMVPLLLLFLPDSAVSHAAETWTRWKDRRWVRFLVTTPLVAIAVWLAAAVVLMAAFQEWMMHTAFEIAGYPFVSWFYIAPRIVAVWWTIIVAGGAALFCVRVLFLRKATAAAESAHVSMVMRGSQIAVVALVALNGMSLWLGLKTRTAFNMYSNLRVEAGYSNHFLVPGSLDVMGNLADTVEILQVSHFYLHEPYVKGGYRMTYFSLGQRVAWDDGLEVIYQRNGGAWSVGKHRDQEPVRIPPWILRKLLVYGPVGDGVEKECAW